MLPTTQPAPFVAVLSYLNGDDALASITGKKYKTKLLLLFAQMWALAARLGLPDLQNKLVLALGAIYEQTVSDNLQNLERHYPADNLVRKALRRLSEEVGKDRHAEEFLICFVARTAPMISDLERQLKYSSFDRGVGRKVLAEARSFDRDPIRYRPCMFRVSVSKPSQYLPLEVHSTRTAGTPYRRVELPEVRNLERRDHVVHPRAGITLLSSLSPAHQSCPTMIHLLYQIRKQVQRHLIKRGDAAATLSMIQPTVQGLPAATVELVRLTRNICSEVSPACFKDSVRSSLSLTTLNNADALKTS
jgi:hypothetical protein